ncbi:inositol monophosphatase [Patescibacteria group bacterium]|nr:inositol monophosphatase [Patescibacteria group bacterium]
MNLHEQLVVAKDAATKAGDIQIQHFGKKHDITYKGSNDFVTNVDLLCEEAIIDRIHETNPDHVVLSEEKGKGNGSSRYLWVVDPLDGTVNYEHGFPYFCTIVSLFDKETEDILVGVVYNPLEDVMYWAIKGEGAYKGDKKVRVSTRKDLAQSFLTFGSFYVTRGPIESPYKSQNESADFRDAFLRTRVIGSAGLDLAHIAEGVADVHISFGAKPWDIFGSSLLVTEAGGSVVDEQGGKITLASKGIIATGEDLIDDVLSLLKK